MSCKTVGFFTHKFPGLEKWDPDSSKKGLPGSEEAVAYLAKQLALLGYEVLVFGNPPNDSPHSKPEANPRYIDSGLDKGQYIDVAIACRNPLKGEFIKKRAGRVYLWPQDIIHYPFPEGVTQNFDDVLWLSSWQREQWTRIDPHFAKYTTIFGNGINPEQFTQKLQTRKNPYSCIYGSNYGKGLALLLDIWPEVKQEFPQATLDLYYGWRHWGLLSPLHELFLRKRVEDLAVLGVRDHGLVGHEAVTYAYEKSSFWTYPCSEPETFCITALRAQFAGAIPVILEGSALKETVRHGYTCRDREEYLSTLLQAMELAEKITLSDRSHMREFILETFTWKKLAEKCEKLFS